MSQSAVSHKQRTLAALKWSFLGQGIQQAVQVALTLILARLLVPEDFGLVGMITVLTGLAGAMRDLGLGSAIVQARELGDELLSTAFWVNILSGAVFCALVALAAPALAAFFSAPPLQSLTLVISLDFLIGAPGVVHAALLQRDLDFRRITLVNTASVLLAGAAGVLAAVAGLGVWSLIIKTLAATATLTLLLWRSHSWRPSLVWRASSLRDVMSFGGPLVGLTALNHVTRNIDNLLIGRYIGAEGLGLYGRAYALMLYPAQNLSHAMSRVLFPSYAEIEDDKLRTKRAFLRVARLVGLLAFPVMFGLAALAEPFTLAVFGEPWRGMIPLVQVLAVVGALQSITALNGTIFLSQGATRLLLRAGGLARLVVIAFIVLGLRWGLYGVAASYLVGTLLTAVPVWHLVGRLIGFSVRELLGHLASVFFAAVAMASAVAVADSYWGESLGDPWLRLAAALLLGLALYALGLATIARPAVREAVAAARDAYRA